MSRVYLVRRTAYIAGATRREGETVPHDTIMRREPWRLGSLLRTGVLEDAAADDEPAGADFGGMTKPALQQWADEHDVAFPEDVTRVAQMREYLEALHENGGG